MINVIKINLNHASSKAARLEIRRERLRWLTFGVIVLLLAGGISWLVFENQQMNDLIAAKETQITQIKEEIATLKSEGKNLSKDDILDLENLESQRVLWATKLKALGTLIPHDMALTRLEFKDVYLTITGISRIYRDEREFDVIEEFIARLENDPEFSHDFENIKFASFARMTVMMQDIVSFEIKATLKGGGDNRKRRGV